MIRDRLFIEQNRILPFFLSFSLFLSSFFSLFLSFFFFLPFFLSFFLERIKVHRQKSRITKFVSFASWFRSTVSLPLKKWFAKEKKKKSIWMTVDKGKVFWKLVKKSIGEREGIGEWILKKCWFSTKEDWIRDERDPAILFQLRSVNIKSRREGFGWKFKDISRDEGITILGKFEKWIFIQDKEMEIDMVRFISLKHQQTHSNS